MIKVELTEEDFSLLIEGLDAIKAKESAGEVMTGIFATIFSKDEAQAKTLTHMLEQKKRQREGAIAVKDESVQILKGKLLQAKRTCAQDEALKQAQEAINK